MLFNAVGDFSHGRYAEGGPEKIAMHALVGGLTAEAMGGDFKTGALAAGANEALVEYLDSHLGSDPKTRTHLLTTASQLVGIVAAELVNGDVHQAAEIAAQATRYNYLAHPEATRLQELNRLLEDDSLTESERQALEEERLAIHVLSQSRDRALEEACGQGGSAQACSYERALLQVAMNSWQDVTLGREDRDTVFAEYLHTAGQYGQHQQQRMERIGAEALTEMVVDSINAPAIMGQLVGQALLGDEESQALLREMGQEIKALFTNPASYITESAHEQLTQADALEQAGQLDEADRLRVRVALENESMLLGTGGLVASLPRLAKSVVTSRSGMAGGGDFSGSRAQDGDVVPNSVGEAHNVANFARYREVLSVSEQASPLVDSLRATGRLPDNFVTKQEAIAAGWRPGKALNNYVPGGQLGGDVFQNTTNVLPSAPGRVWYEADVGLSGTMSRANQPGTRLLYSNDGQVYITTDHYKTVHPFGGQ